MPLALLDWVLIAGYFVVSLGIGLWFKKRASSSVDEYFASGRSMPWLLAGTSMVATTFAADTPLAVTGLVAKHGLAGNWFWWSWAFGGMLTVFVFAKLWRRAEVLTDVELIEQRYAGRPAAFLRGFRAIYVAVVVNSFVIGWVTFAMVTVLRETVLHGVAADGGTDLLLVAVLLAVTGLYSALSGMWGVAVTDAVQFVLAMIGCIVLAVIAVGAVGGVDALQQRVEQNFGGQQMFAFVPDFDSAAWMPIGVFAALVLGQWWATWYPGAEPGGGGYIVQRMASCRNERDAVKATLLFQIAHYCVRPWPWILVAFAALALHPELREPAQLEQSGRGFPMLIRELAPTGLRGLLLVTFAAAYMSTISTQTNWGASYLINDVYRRFLAPTASERDLVRTARRASLLVAALGGAAAWWMLHFQITPEVAWAYLAALGGGLGSVFVLRWFWWRVNAWSEITAMVGSVVAFFAISTWQAALPATERLAGQYTSLLVATSTLVVWLVVTFATKPEPMEKLQSFYRRVRPDGPGWGPVAATTPDARPDGTLGRGILCAVLGTTVVWSTLPGIGAVIFGEWMRAGACLAVATIAGILLFTLMPRTAATPDSTG